MTQKSNHWPKRFLCIKIFETQTDSFQDLADATYVFGVFFTTFLLALPEPRTSSLIRAKTQKQRGVITLRASSIHVVLVMVSCTTAPIYSSVKFCLSTSCLVPISAFSRNPEACGHGLHIFHLVAFCFAATVDIDSAQFAILTKTNKCQHGKRVAEIIKTKGPNVLGEHALFQPNNPTFDTTGTLSLFYPVALKSLMRAALRCTANKCHAGVKSSMNSSHSGAEEF